MRADIVRKFADLFSVKRGAALTDSPANNEGKIGMLDNTVEVLPLQGSGGSRDARSLAHIIREGRLNIDVALAHRILEEAPYERQRKTYEHHTALLADSMSRERWTSGSQIAFGWFNNRLHLVNGRHRMAAVIKSGRTIQFQVLIEECATEAELDALYWRFDVAQRQRSINEILNASEVAEQHGISKLMAKATYEAVALITNKMARPQYLADPVRARSVDARLDAAKAWWPIAPKYEAAISTAPRLVKKKLYGGSVAAVGLVTFKYQPEGAFQFWRGLSDNDGLRRGDPRHTLLLDLQSRNLATGSAHQAAYVSAHAWSYFYEGHALKIIKVLQSSVVRIAGTPFDGRRA